MNITTRETLFSSESAEWSTPQDLFDELNLTYDFTYDLAATIENTKCSKYYDKRDNALCQDWHTLNGWLWLNPPYGRSVNDWVEKAYEESRLGAKIVMLLPSRTGTKWFHNFIYKKPGVSIDFIKGRLKFGNSKNSAPFDSILVEFKSPTDFNYS